MGAHENDEISYGICKPMKVCPDCHKMSDDKEEFCPRCGCRFDAYIVPSGDPEAQATRDVTRRMVRGKYRADRNKKLLALSLVVILVAGMFLYVGSSWNSTEVAVVVGDSEGAAASYTLYIDGKEYGSGLVPSGQHALLTVKVTWAVWEFSKTATVTVDYGVSEASERVHLVSGTPVQVTLLR